MFICQVLIERSVRSLDTPFSYLSLEPIQRGIRVKVPFNHKLLVGFVLEVEETSLSKEELDEQAGFTHELIDSVLDDTAILTDELEQLASSLSKMTFTPLVACYKTMLPPPLKISKAAKGKVQYRKFVVFDQIKLPLTPKQRAFLLELKEIQSIRLSDVSNPHVVHALEKKGCLHIEEREVLREVEPSRLSTTDHLTLTFQQQEVLERLFSDDPKKPFLLYGITGSGKTEVYLQASKHVIEEGKQVLMLVPEISLTPKMVALYQQRFGNLIAILHSGLSDGQRYDEYRRILRHEVKIVVGARSAIFAPLNDIGLIILDEEHDSSYKQGNAPRYHTRDVAIWRMHYHQARLLLGSASPSLESYAKANNGLYHLLTMTSRATASSLASTKIVDMTKEARRGNLDDYSKDFMSGLKQCLDEGHQALILVNRRGYASYVLCRECGYVPKCPHCDVTLTYHKEHRVLSCHYCGYEESYQAKCPECHSKQLSFRRLGTEHVQEELEERFSNAKIIRYDVDTTKKKGGHEAMLKQFENQEANILLGTQMIAKGLDFPNVTFVGVIDGDSALDLPDYRSSERTFQLLLQVAGRSGRHQDGEVVIQTYHPEHNAILQGAAQNYDAFYKEELKLRSQLYYPPYCYLLSLLFYGKNEQEVQKVSFAFQKQINDAKLKDIQILGPAPSAISMINKDYRYRLLIKYRMSKDLFEVIQNCLKSYKGNVKIDVDVNPYSQL